MKKILASLLVLCIVVSVLPIATASDPSADGESLDMAAKVMLNLGIMEMDHDNVFAGEKIMTRADAAIALAKMMNYAADTPLESTVQIFEDVRVWDDSASAVECLYNRNVIKGNGYGKFYPEDDVTMSDLYRMMLRCAGYGDFTTDVYTLAASAKLTKGVSGDRSGKITKSMLAHALCNLLDAKVMTVNGIKNEQLSLHRGDTFLNEVMELYKTEGVVTANETVNIKENPTPEEGKVQIDMVSYETNGLDINGLLGYSVICYYKQDDDETPVICAIVENDSNNVLMLDNDSIISVSGKTYSYYRADGKNVTARLAPSVNVVYNDRVIDDDEHYRPGYGRVTLIDNNRDSLYDVALISSYSTMIVKGADGNAKKIYVENIASGKDEVISLDDYNEYGLYDSYGYQITPDELQSGMVLSVQESLDSADSYIKFSASSATAKGVIEEIRSGAHRKITINGTEYEESPQMRKPDRDICAVGKNLVLCLDILGKIVYVKQNEEEGWFYGYLIGAAVSDDWGDHQLKLLTQEGNVEVVTCDDKVLINGIKGTTNALKSALYSDGAVKRQVIRYLLKNQKIREIDTAIPQSIADTDPVNIGNGVGDKLLLRSSGTFRYKNGPRLLKRESAGSPDGEIALASADSLIIFAVPADTSLASDDDYYIMNGLRDDQSYTAEGYNTSADSIRCNVITVFQKQSESFIAMDPVMMVDYVSEVVAADGTDTYMVTGLCDNKRVSYTAKSKDVLTVNNKYTVQQGDIIRIKTDDRSGEIKTIQLVYSDSGAGLLSESAPMTSAGFNDEYRMVYGTISYVDSSGYMLFQCADTSKLNEVFNVSSAGIYIYNKDLRDANVYSGSLSNLYKGAKAVIHTRHSTVVGMFVIE